MANLGLYFNEWLRAIKNIYSGIMPLSVLVTKTSNTTQPPKIDIIIVKRALRKTVSLIVRAVNNTSLSITRLRGLVLEHLQ